MNLPTKNHYIWAVLLFVVGFAVHALFFKASPTEMIPASQTDLSSLEERVEELTDQLASLQTENALLKSSLEDKARTQPEVVTLVNEPENTENDSVGTVQAFSFSDERFKDMMTRQVNQQLDVYAARLNLSDDQRSQLEEIMLLRMLQFRERMGPGGPRSVDHDSDTPLITQNDIDNLAAEILSASQLEEYDEMRAQEIASRSEMMATSQLSQIAPQLGLSEEQKDLVYTIYYNQSMQMTDGPMNPDQMRETQEQTDEQIREILDEKQRDVFKTIRENQNFGNFTIIAR